MMFNILSTQSSGSAERKAHSVRPIHRQFPLEEMAQWSPAINAGKQKWNKENIVSGDSLELKLTY